MSIAMATPIAPSLPNVLSPVSADERSQWLDALRGFALLGILLTNIQVFSGYVFRDALSAPPALIAAALDPALSLLAHALIDGKFYCLFSFLFGLGIALQMRQAEARGADAVPMLRRRLGWLLAFGFVHGVLIWGGDILTVYAVFGFALLLFRGMSQRGLLIAALFFLAMPVLAYLAMFALQMGDPLAGDPTTPPSQGLVGKLARGMATGNYADVVQGNAVFYAGGWIRRAVRLALPRIFGMFLLGVWAARIGLPALRDMQRPLLRRWLLWGLLLGLPLNFAFAALGANNALFPTGGKGLLAIVLASAGMPLLCLGYVAAFALGWRRLRDNSLFVAAGRTAFSHYLGQSVVCVILFYGIGFGLFGSVSYGIALLFAAAVFVLLAWCGRWWLRRHPQGPMEALWRRLSYRQRAAALKDAEPAA